MQLCCTLEISLLDFLTAEPIVTDCKQKAMLFQRKPKKPYTTLNTDALLALRKALQQALIDYPPLPLIEVASRLGYYPQLLTYHYPALCNQLQVRRANYKKICLRQEIQTGLEAALKEEPPPSVMKVAKRLGYASSGSMYQLFPELCYQVSARYKDYQKTRSLENRQKRCQEVRQIALQLHEQGQTPSTVNVSRLLTKPKAFLSIDAQMALREVRCELGYEK